MCFPVWLWGLWQVFQGTNQTERAKQEKKYDNDQPTKLKQRLRQVGLADIDIVQCHADQSVKERLVELLEKYSELFSKHTPDCGEAKGTHRIRLTDERPFRLPNQWVPPDHHQKLWQVLSEMEV